MDYPELKTGNPADEEADRRAHTYWLEEAHRYERAGRHSARAILWCVLGVVVSYAPLDKLGLAWLKEAHPLLAGMAIATPIAFLIYFILRRDVARGLLLDLPAIRETMASNPLLPLLTVRWLVARRRLLRSLFRPCMWLVAEILIIVISIVSSGLFRSLSSPNDGAVGALILIVAFFTPLTFLVVLFRTAEFLTGSWLARRET